jgi:uncharacterized membrane protein YfcA
MSDAVTVLLVLVAGFFTGVLSGLFGVGGAVISTPSILALGATPLESVGSTVPSIIPSSISGTFRYMREGLVVRRVVLATGLAGATFATAGAIASEEIPGKGHVQMVLTAGLMAFTAYRTARGAVTSEALPPDRQHQEIWRLATIGLAAGLLSGFLGVGGGILMVPAFTGWVGMDLKAAIGTSLACVGIISVPNTVAHQILGNVNWFYALPLMVGAIPGARVGAHFAIKARDRTLRIVVASVLGTIAAVYGTVEFIRLVR